MLKRPPSTVTVRRVVCFRLALPAGISVTRAPVTGSLPSSVTTPLTVPLMGDTVFAPLAADGRNPSDINARTTIAVARPREPDSERRIVFMPPS
jgi:hypothetical protein